MTARLTGVSFDVRAGEIVGIAGRRRQRPDELIEALAGLVAAAAVCAARSAFEGATLRGSTRGARRELGIAHIPEDRHRRGLLLDFTLAENSILGVHYRPPAVAAGS